MNNLTDRELLDGKMKYFTFKEMIQSDTAKSKGIENIPDWDQIDALKSLIETILDPLRELWGGPIVVTSGYRTKELNKAVGGVSNSHHTLGCAADITVGSISKNKKLLKLLLNSNLQWTQVISEKGCRWLHVSYIENDLRNQVLYT